MSSVEPSDPAPTAPTAPRTPVSGARLPLLRTAARVLTLRAGRDELLRLDGRHLAFGLVFTWLVGMGRYWDNPRAVLLQHLGVGSLVYVFVLSGFLWAVLRPLRPQGFTYRRLLTYVTLTSPPAILYAIPVELWLELRTAASVNAWFLAVVAAWRVALLARFLHVVARLRWYAVVVATLLPLTVIVTALTALNLERVVFQIMGGLAETPNDTAYGVLVALTFLSALAILPLLAAYITLIVVAHRRRPTS